MNTVWAAVTVASLAAAVHAADDPPAPPPAGIAPLAKAEFDRVTVSIKPSFRSTRAPEVVAVSADGACAYEVQARPAQGAAPEWGPARLGHTLPADRVRELGGLLKDADWLAKVPGVGPPQLHGSTYDLTLTRGGKTTTVTVPGGGAGYEKLLHFFESVAAENYLIYRLGYVPAAMTDARRELDMLVGAELGEPYAKSPYTIDLARYLPWATRLVRKPFDEPTDDVRAAVRLVGLLKRESEREYLADLAADRDRGVRTAVAAALGRMGGAKSVPVLRKLVRSTGADAAWEFIRVADAATIADVIRAGEGVDDLSHEWLVRAYLDHWKDVPRPLDPRVLEAVRINMEKPAVRAHRTEYHKELLKRAAGGG